MLALSCRRHGRRPLGRAEVSCCADVGTGNVIESDCGGGAWAVVIWRRTANVCDASVRGWREGSACAFRPSTCLCAGDLVSVSGRVYCVCLVIDLAVCLYRHLCLLSGRAACLLNDPSSSLQICPSCCSLTCRAVCLSSGLYGGPLIYRASSRARLLVTFCRAPVSHLDRACLRLLLAKDPSVCGLVSDP